MVERRGMESACHDISFKKSGCKGESSKHTCDFKYPCHFPLKGIPFSPFFIQLPNLSFRLNSHITLPEPQVLLGSHLGTHSP